MSGDRLVDQRQADARAPLARREERVEDALAKLGRHARSAVAHLHHRLAARGAGKRRAGRDPEHAVVPGRAPEDAQGEPRRPFRSPHRLERVGDQVRERAAELLGVALDDGRRRFVLARQLAVEGEPRAHLGEGGLQSLDEVDRRRDAGRRLHEVERGGHGRLEGPHLGETLVCERTLLARPRQAPAQETAQHAEARERIADLVGQPGGHLPERGQALAQALALVEPLERLEVAEQERGAARDARPVSHAREREADRARRGASGAERELGPRGGERELGPRRRLAALESREQELGHQGLRPERLAAGPAQDLFALGDAEHAARGLVQDAHAAVGVDRRQPRTERAHQPGGESVLHGGTYRRTREQAEAGQASLRASSASSGGRIR